MTSVNFPCAATEVRFQPSKMRVATKGIHWYHRVGRVQSSTINLPAGFNTRRVSVSRNPKAFCSTWCKTRDNTHTSAILLANGKRPSGSGAVIATSGRQDVACARPAASGSIPKSLICGCNRWISRSNVPVPQPISTNTFSVPSSLLVTSRRNLLTGIVSPRNPSYKYVNQEKRSGGTPRPLAKLLRMCTQRSHSEAFCFRNTDSQSASAVKASMHLCH